MSPIIEFYCSLPAALSRESLYRMLSRRGNPEIATPIKQMGMNAYKKLKIINAEPEIRETIDYILDENTM